MIILAKVELLLVTSQINNRIVKLVAFISDCKSLTPYTQGKPSWRMNSSGYFCNYPLSILFFLWRSSLLDLLLNIHVCSGLFFFFSFDQQKKISLIKKKDSSHERGEAISYYNASVLAFI